MDPASPPQEAAVAGLEALPGFYQCWTLAVAAILAITITRASVRAWKRRNSIEREKEEQELVLARLRRRLQEEKGQQGNSSTARTSGDRQTSQTSEPAVESDGGPVCSRPPSTKGRGGRAAPTEPKIKDVRAGAASRRQAGGGAGDQQQPPPGGRGGQAVGLPEPYLPSLSPSPSSSRASAAPPSSSHSPRPSPAAAAVAPTRSPPSAPPPSNPWSAGPVETLARYPFLRDWASEMSQAATDLLQHARSSSSQGEEGAAVVVVGLVVKVLQNLLAHPHDPRYRSFRPAASSSFRSLWRCPPAQALLRKLGFRPLRPAVTTPAAASSSGERRPSQQGAVEEGAQGAEEEGGDVVVELPGLTEAHLEVIRKLLADSLLPFLLQHQQQQQQATARPAQPPSNSSSGGFWSEGDHQLSCGVCGREDLFVDREAARPEVLFRARHARVAVHCTSCALLVCGECYNLRGGSLPHDTTHQMVLLAPADVGDELGQEEGEERGGRWRRCPPVPRDRRPGRGPWG